MTRLLACLVPAVLLVFSTVAGALDEAERLQFADGLYTRNMYELAQKEYEAFLKTFPDSKHLDVVHFRLAECMRGQGRKEDAGKEFAVVFKNAASEFRFKAGFKRAEIFSELGKPDTAIELLSAVLKENPPDDIAAASLYHLGDLLAKNGKLEDAVKMFEQIRGKYPAAEFFSVALLRLGDIYGKDGAKETEALKLYVLAAAKPASPRIGAEALFQAAELFFKRKEYEKSADSYKKLLADYPSDQRVPEARIQAGWAQHNAGFFAEAMRIAEESLKMNAPGAKAEWLYLKANCERQLMKNEEAVRTYAQILTQHADSSFQNASRYETALTFYKMGKYMNAVREADKVKLLPEIKKDVYWLFAESYSAMKDADKAIQYYRLLVKEFPKSDVAADATYRLAHHLQVKKEYREASRYYSTVAEDFPATKLAPQALYASAFCLAKENMSAEALRDWSTLIVKYPGDPLVEEALYQKALSETRIRRDKESLDTFRELLKKFPKSRYAADAHYWQGMFLSDQKRWQDAEDELRQALKAAPAAKELEREAQFGLAAVLQKTGKLEESAGILQGLIASPIKDKIPSELVRWLSEYMFDNKKYSESVAAAQVLLLRSNEPDWQQTGWCLIGRAYFVEQNLKSAGDAYKKALAVKAATPFAAEAAMRLGDIMFGEKKFDDALKNYEQAAKLSSDESLLGVRARSYAGLGRSSKAKNDLENAARYFMSVAILYDDADLVSECLYEAADAFNKLGKKDDSGKAVKELLERYPNSVWAKKPEIEKLR